MNIQILGARDSEAGGSVLIYNSFVVPEGGIVIGFNDPEALARRNRMAKILDERQSRWYQERVESGIADELLG
jgi:hypothetical protein